MHLIARFFLMLGLALIMPSSLPAAPGLPPGPRMLDTMRRTAEWQLAQLDANQPSANHRRNLDPRDWTQATFWLGMTALADVDDGARYRNLIFALGGKQGWRLGKRLHHADDHLIGQVWLWAAANGAGSSATTAMQSRLDSLLADRRSVDLRFAPKSDGGSPDCVVRWCWCDALFMSPATLFGLSRATKDNRYADFADAEFRATANLLYDPKLHLFYRDSRFLGQTDKNGHPLLWSRGNGWVLAGLARSIPLIEANDARRAFYITLFRDMAERVAGLQRADGYWPSSLLGGEQPPESSGTALFVFALARGINAGLLDRATYLPVVIRGWAALGDAIEPSGRLGWVQPISDRPGEASETDNQAYGTGAVLLAAAEVYKLAH